MFGCREDGVRMHGARLPLALHPSHWGWKGRRSLGNGVAVGTHSEPQKGAGM